jgi:hypothetical protein
VLASNKRSRGGCGSTQVICNAYVTKPAATYDTAVMGHGTVTGPRSPDHTRNRSTHAALTAVPPIPVIYPMSKCPCQNEHG